MLSSEDHLTESDYLGTKDVSSTEISIENKSCQQMNLDSSYSNCLQNNLNYANQQQLQSSSCCNFYTNVNNLFAKTAQPGVQCQQTIANSTQNTGASNAAFQGGSNFGLLNSDSQQRISFKSSTVIANHKANNSSMMSLSQQIQMTPRSANKENEINEGIAKRLTELESELVREKAAVQVLSMEKQNLEQQLSSSMRQSQQQQQLQQEAADWQLALQEKDVLIQQLMEELNNKSISELNTEAEKAQFRGTLTSFKTSIMELEGKLALLATENERLNQKVQLKDNEIGKKGEENAALEEFLRAQYEEKVKDWEQKLNTLMQENDKIVLINQNLQKKLEQSTNQLQTVEECREQETKEQLEHWRQHYEKRLKDVQEREQVEKNLVEQQLKHSLQLSAELEQKVDAYLTEIEFLKKEILQRDSLLTDFEARACALEQKADEAQTLQSQCQGLQQNVKEGENKLNVLLNENTHLADIAALSQQEVVTWKAKFETQTKNFQLLTEENKRVLEEQKRQIQTSERKNWEGAVEKTEREKQTLEEKIVQMAVELEKCHDLIHKLRKDSESLREEKKRVSALEEQNAALEEHSTRQSARLKNLEQKLELLVQDNAQLNTTTQRRIEETEVWRNKCQVQERNFELKQQEFRATLESEYRLKTDAALNDFGLQKAALETELNKHRARALDLERVQETLLADMSSQGQLLQARTKELDEVQKSLRLLKNELENANRIGREKSAELEDEKQRTSRREKQEQEYATEMKKKLLDAEARADADRRSLQEQRQAGMDMKQRLEVHATEVDKWKKIHAGLTEKTEKLIEENGEMVKKVQQAEKYRVEYEKQLETHALQMEELVREQEGRMKLERGKLEARVNQMTQQIEQLEESRREETDMHGKKLIEMQEKHTDDLQQMQALFEKRQAQIQEKCDLELEQLHTVKANLFADNEVLKRANDKMVREIENLKKKNHDLQQLAHAAATVRQPNKRSNNIDNGQALDEADPDDFNRVMPYNSSRNQHQGQMNKRSPSLDAFPKMHGINRPNTIGRQPFAHVMMNNNKPTRYNGCPMQQPPQQPEFYGCSLAEENDRMNRNILNRCRGICMDKNYMQQ